MKNLSLADLIQMRQYLLNNQPAWLNVEQWGVFIKMIELRIEREINQYYLTITKS